jgi:hypothetical protein
MVSQPDTFVEDLRRFGPKVALRRLDVRERIRDFRTRQFQLAVTAAALALMSLLMGDVAGVGLIPALLMVQTGRCEAWRMRTTGRYWRTWVREPSAPEEIEYVERIYVRRERP